MTSLFDNVDVDALPKWRCPTCLVDLPEPFCSCCGLDLSHHQTTEAAGENPARESAPTASDRSEG